MSPRDRRQYECFWVDTMDAYNRFERVRAAIEQLGPADHVCTLYDQRDEELAIAVSYVRVGLKRSELCVCVVDDGGKNILEALASEGIDTDAEMRKGRLVIFEKPLAQGLQTQDMLRKIEHYAGGARSAGHAGFRIVGEMTWALGGDLKALAEFEARLNLNRVWERYACVGLCQFDVRQFTPEMLREIIIVHPLVVIGDRVCRNPYYVAPERYLSPEWPSHEADWMMTNLEQLQEAQDSLQASQERYRALSGRLLRLQDEERRRIARDLHDSTGQDLVALATMLGQLRRSTPSGERNSRRLLSQCKALADGCIRDIRTLSYVLHPPVLDAAGLGDAIRDYVDGFTKRSGIQAELELSSRLGRLTGDVELALYRVVQESLNNIQRHSGSQQAKIRIRCNSHLIMEISDLGRGLSTVTQKQKEGPRVDIGVGIPSMRERVKLIGGRLDIDSSSNGTTVRVTLSLGGEHEKTPNSDS